jgi:hypothetical protein
MGVAVFVSSLGTFLYAKSPGPRGQPLPAASRLTATENAEESWYTVMFHSEGSDKRIGWTHSVQTKTPQGLKIDEEIHLKMTLMGQARDVVTKQSLNTGADGVIQNFNFFMESAGTTVKIDGTQAPGEVRLLLTSAGVTQAVNFPVSEPIVMSGNLPRELARAGLEPGKTYSRSFFDPSVMKPSRMTIKIEAKEKLKVAARTIDVYRVKQIYNGLETTSWVDKEGKSYKEESPTGFSSYRTTKDEAMRLGSGAAIDLISATSVPAENSAPHPRTTQKMVIDLDGVDLKGFDLDGDGQKLVGNRLTIDHKTPVASKIDTASYLASEPLMQVDDPAVKKALLEATGGYQDKTEISKRVLRWVFGNLEKTSTVSLPSAVEVLRSRQGDCNEHAILYTAMARAGGVPARIASGLVALDDHFYYHAWSEIYLDGKWISVDPVFGQYPADATHVRFVLGGLERQAELMRVIGKLKMKVVSYE